MLNATHADIGLFRLHQPDVIADPVPFYTGLLSTHPIVFDTASRAWLVSRYADVQAVLAHPGSSTHMDHAAALAILPTAGLDVAFSMLDRHVSFVDGPEHARLRHVLAAPVAVRHVRAGLSQAIIDAVTAALDDIAGMQQVDVVAAVAARVPIAVTRHLLGMHDVDDATVRRWSLAWGDVVAAPGHVPTTDRAAVLRSVDELVAHLEQLISRREHGAGPVTGRLLAAIAAGQLTREEAVANLMMLTAAGSETTANLMSATLMVLADHPDLWALIHQTPERIDDLVDEIGRVHPPTQYTARRLHAAIELSTGDVLPAGASVVVMLAAANRDPAVFDEPDQIRLDRNGPRPVTFGHGPHRCFGAALAHQELHVLLHQLTARYTALTALPGRSWRRNANLRGLDSLNIRLVPRTVAGR